MTAERRLASAKDGGVLWLCNCECGGIKIVKSSALTRKDGKATKSCGCLGGGGKPSEITGVKSGRLTALRSLGKQYGNGRHHYWECSCECGHMVHVIAKSIISGYTKSCGCLMLEVMSELHKKHGLSNTKEYQRWCNLKRVGKLSKEHSEDIYLWMMDNDLYGDSYVSIKQRFY